MDFYFAKLNYTRGIFADENKPLYETTLLALQQSGTTIYRGGPFMIIDIFGSDRIDYVFKSKHPFIAGRLVKYRDEEVTAVDSANHGVVLVKVPDKIVAQSYFVIDFKENLLLYTEDNRISKNSFIDRFNALLEQGFSRFEYECMAIPIHDNYTFLDALKKFTEVYELELRIRPTNPFPADIIADMDKKLNNQNVREKIIKYKAKKGGINLDDKEIETNTVYTDVGYGTGNATGKTEKNEVITIHSVKSQRQKKVPIEDVKNMGPYELMQRVDARLNEKN